MSDERPDVWIGHISLAVADARKAADFYESLGMRTVHLTDDVGIMELRGGTHLVLAPGDVEPGREAGFDLMVDDVDAMHAKWSAAGHEVTEIGRGDIHDWFHLTDPDGAKIPIYSSHVIGPV